MIDALCIGDINLDLITDKINKYPKKDRQITTNIKRFIGGSSALCACGLSCLGLKTGFVGRIGNGLFGDFILSKLKKYKVVPYLKKGKLNTALTFAVTFKDGKRSFITSKGANKSLKYNDIPLKILKKSKHMHLSGIWHLESLLKDIKKTLKKAKHYGLSTSCDIGATIEKENWKSINWLDLIDVLFLNDIELKLLTGKNIDKGLNYLLKKVKIIGLHLGKKGGLAASKKEKIYLPAFKAKVINPTGAGDAYNSGFLFGYLKNYSLKKCLILALRNSSLYIKRKEQKFSSKKELLKFIS